MLREIRILSLVKLSLKAAKYPVPTECLIAYNTPWQNNEFPAVVVAINEISTRGKSLRYYIDVILEKN
jgi:hypothetical protein